MPSFGPLPLRAGVRLAPLLLVAVAAQADVTLPAVLSTHAVLQRTTATPVWGRANPGEDVTVSLGEARASATTGADGRWRVALDLSGSAVGPLDLVVKGDNTLVVRDVVVGEVWLASGQSNMEWTVRNTTGGAEVVAASANPLIRQFLVKKNTSPTPLEDVEGEWMVAGPATTSRFSATGYFFAQAIHRATGAAVGLLNASWGGTNIEGWTSPEGLARLPELKASADRYQAEEQSFPRLVDTFVREQAAWAAANGRGDAASSAPADAASLPDRLDWRPARLPAPAGEDPAAGGGVAWWRRTVEVPAGNAGLQQALEVGRIDGFHTVYFNGEKVAEVTPATGIPRPGPVYVKDSLVKAGGNEIVLRIMNPAASPVVRSGPPFRFIYRPLAGEWQVAVERTFPELSAEARAAMPAAPLQPLKPRDIGGYLYNAMIHPLTPCAIRGVIWYQGESNGRRAFQYRAAFPNLIEDWRARRGDPGLPFYFCQLANFGAKGTSIAENATAELREAQSLALRLPATGQAVLIDVGEADDIHPRNKRDVGERLARIALANTYGRGDVAFAGPVVASHRVEDGRMRIVFAGAVGGLVARPLPATYAPRSTVDRVLPLELPSPGSELQGFVICGADRAWRWAQARVEGDTVVVWSPEVPEPVAVRYAWSGNPTCNLYDGAGLPASPFRTDDFPLATRHEKY